jgi:hypothetical protein
MHKLAGDITATLAGISAAMTHAVPDAIALAVLICSLVWWGFRFYEKFTGKTIGKKPCQ